MVALMRMPGRRSFLIAAGIWTFSISLPAVAQRVRRIGFLGTGSRETLAIPVEAFRKGLRDLGWAEGKDIVIEYRFADGAASRLPAFAADLVQLGVDIIVTWSTPAALAAKQATTTIPVVMTFVADPVGSGLIANLARPGGNVTGLTTLASGFIGKRLELLKTLVPGSSRIAILWQPDAFPESTMRAMVDEAETAARALGVRLQFVEARRPDDIEQAFAAIKQTRADGLVVFPGPMLFAARRNIVAHAADARVAAVYTWTEATDAGGLMSYATDLPDMYRRAATYVDKILKGTKPGDLAVEQPTKFELTINMKTAKALRLKIPREIAMRADRLIE